jgi:PST family polysaccharide transporter
MSGDPKASGGEARVVLPRLLQNTVALYIVQIANIVVPVLTFPYIVQVLGIAPFGRLSYALGVAQLIGALVEFGFNLSATQRVATDAAAKGAASDAVAWTFTTVAAVRVALFTLVGGATTLGFWLAGDGTATLLVLLTPLVLGEVLTPTWLFQALERMRFLPVFTVGGRLVGIVLLFALVRSPDDLPLAAFVQSVPFLVSGVIAHVVILRRFGLAYRWDVPRGLARELVVDAFKVFAGRLAGHIYVRGPIILLRALTDDATVGAYSIAQRVASLLTGLVQPLAQSLYPRLCVLYAEGEAVLAAFQKRVLTGAVLGLAALGLTLAATRRLIVWIIAGQSESQAETLLLLFAPVIFVTGLNVLLNVLMMARKRYVSMGGVLWLGAAAFVLTAYPLVRAAGAAGLVVAQGVVETAVLIAIVVLMRSSGRAA